MCLDSCLSVSGNEALLSFRAGWRASLREARGMETQMAANGLAEIISYEGDNLTFVKKHPTTDFHTGSVLIVHESQEAVFFSSGEALDSFGPGSYPIETENLPLVSRFFNRVMGDRSPFHCEVYFINKTEQLAIKWGTDSKLEYIEPTYGFPIQLGASGEMSLQVDDGRKLLIKVVGTETELSQQKLLGQMRAFLIMKVKPYLARLMREKRWSVFEIDEHIEEISAALKGMLVADFADYGLALERFFVTAIVKPEGDRNYQRFKELHFRQYADITEAKLRQQVGVIDQQTQAQRMVIEAEGISQKRKLEGYTYQIERGFDVAEKVAANEAVGQIGNLGIGMGMISGVGGVVGGKVGGILRDTLEQPQTPPPVPELLIQCAKCGAKAPSGAKFCPGCGAALQGKCTGCGGEVPAGAKFCPWCGANQ